MKSDNALSEIVGALILVALVITGIGIIGVLMFSMPPPDAKEKVVISSSSLQCDEDSFIIVVRHEGGDVINPKNMKFFLSTEFQNKTLMNYFQVYPTSLFPAEVFTSMDKGQMCDPDKVNAYLIDENDKSLKTGDVILIWYDMDKTSEN